MEGLSNSRLPSERNLLSGAAGVKEPITRTKIPALMVWSRLREIDESDIDHNNHNNGKCTTAGKERTRNAKRGAGW